MKYVILIHSNPQPWGHPTSDFVAEHQALPEQEREALEADFESVMQEMSEPRRAARWPGLRRPGRRAADPLAGGRRKITDGPYAETVEQFAGFFLIDVASQERAEEVAEKFAGPGETVELRPVAN